MRLIREGIDRALFEYSVACESVDREKAHVEEASEEVSDIGGAQVILQSASQLVQQQAHQRIAEVVSRCLSAIFDEPYEFRILFEKKRGATEARLVFVKDEVDIDPMTASGGGVVDVASFALRLACLALSRPQLRKLLVLDEPFKHLSVEYRPRVSAFMQLLAEEMGVQVLMVTHDPHLTIGKVVEL